MSSMKNQPNEGAPNDLGKLHQLLRKGLPDYVENGLLNTKRLAADLKISHQAIYKWFKLENLNPGRVGAIVGLSESTVDLSDDFKPLTRDDFWAFMGRREASKN